MDQHKEKLMIIRLLTIAYTMIFSIPISAGLIDNGLYTTDSESGLDWLDITQTSSISYNAVISQLGVGGIFDGWQVASIEQVEEFFDNAGGNGNYTGYDGFSHNSVAPLIVDLWGINGTYVGDFYHRSWGLTKQEPGTTGFYSAVATKYLPYYPPENHPDKIEILYTSYIDADRGYTYAGTALVRTAIPEPSTVSLLFICLLCLWLNIRNGLPSHTS